MRNGIPIRRTLSSNHKFTRGPPILRYTSIEACARGRTYKHIDRGVSLGVETITERATELDQSRLVLIDVSNVVVAVYTSIEGCLLKLLKQG